MGRKYHACSLCGDIDRQRRAYIRMRKKWLPFAWYCPQCRHVDMDPAYAPA